MEDEEKSEKERKADYYANILSIICIPIGTIASIATLVITILK